MYAFDIVPAKYSYTDRHIAANGRDDCPSVDMSDLM